MKLSEDEPESAFTCSCWVGSTIAETAESPRRAEVRKYFMVSVCCDRDGLELVSVIEEKKKGSDCKAIEGRVVMPRRDRSRDQPYSGSPLSSSLSYPGLRYLDHRDNDIIIIWSSELPVNLNIPK